MSIAAGSAGDSTQGAGLIGVAARTDHDSDDDIGGQQMQDPADDVTDAGDRVSCGEADDAGLVPPVTERSFCGYIWPRCRGRNASLTFSLASFR
jgi:hypothetical protein